MLCWSPWKPKAPSTVPFSPLMTVLAGSIVCVLQVASQPPLKVNVLLSLLPPGWNDRPAAAV